MNNISFWGTLPVELLISALKTISWFFSWIQPCCRSLWKQKSVNIKRIWECPFSTSVCWNSMTGSQWNPFSFFRSPTIHLNVTQNKRIFQINMYFQTNLRRAHKLLIAWLDPWQEPNCWIKIQCSRPKLLTIRIVKDAIQDIIFRNL